MIELILSALCDTFKAAGITAVREFPADRLPDFEDFLVCVGILSSRSLSSGFGDYLGTRSDPLTLLESELYALRLELEISLDIYARPGSNPGLGLISEALASLPSGLRFIELRSGETRFDRDTELLKTPATLKGSAYLTAAADEDCGEFYDFVLKGVVE